MKEGLFKGADGKYRCWWPEGNEAYIAYHDNEWGVPERDDHKLFEKICLEGFQAGLSWLTILRKRENFRLAFKDFHFEEVANFGEKEVQELLKNEGIIRHQGKIRSTINNAQKALLMRAEFGTLADYFWQFVPPASERPKANNFGALKQLSQTPTSIKLSKNLKQRGWKFVGPTTMYAFMQAMGLVDDHVDGCHCRKSAS